MRSNTKQGKQVKAMLAALLEEAASKQASAATQLYDDALNRIAVLIIRWERLYRAMDSHVPEAFKKSLEISKKDIEEDFRALSNNLRDVAANLYPSHLELLGLHKSIQALNALLKEQTGMLIHFEHDNEQPRGLAKKPLLESKIYAIYEKVLDHFSENLRCLSLGVLFKVDGQNLSIDFVNTRPAHFNNTHPEPEIPEVSRLIYLIVAMTLSIGGRIKDRTDYRSYIGLVIELPEDVPASVGSSEGNA